MMEVFECTDGFLCDRDKPCGEVNSDGDELFEEVSNEEINDELLRLQSQLTEALRPKVCRWSYETGVTGCHHLVTGISGDPF